MEQWSQLEAEPASSPNAWAEASAIGLPHPDSFNLSRKIWELASSPTKYEDLYRKLRRAKRGSKKKTGAEDKLFPELMRCQMWRVSPHGLRHMLEGAVELLT